jgi:hypothetical protein
LVDCKMHFATWILAVGASATPVNLVAVLDETTSMESIFSDVGNQISQAIKAIGEAEPDSTFTILSVNEVDERKGLCAAVTFNDKADAAIKKLAEYLPESKGRDDISEKKADGFTHNIPEDRCWDPAEDLIWCSISYIQELYHNTSAFDDSVNALLIVTDDVPLISPDCYQHSDTMVKDLPGTWKEDMKLPSRDVYETKKYSPPTLDLYHSMLDNLSIAPLYSIAAVDGHYEGPWWKQELKDTGANVTTNFLYLHPNAKGLERFLVNASDIGKCTVSSTTTTTTEEPTTTTTTTTEEPTTTTTTTTEEPTTTTTTTTEESTTTTTTTTEEPTTTTTTTETMGTTQAQEEARAWCAVALEKMYKDNCSTEDYDFCSDDAQGIYGCDCSGLCSQMYLIKDLPEVRDRQCSLDWYSQVSCIAEVTACKDAKRFLDEYSTWEFKPSDMLLYL